MRIYAVIAIFGLSLLLTGCPDKPEKSEHAMPMDKAGNSHMTTENEMPEKMDGMEHMEGENKMEGSMDQNDSQ